MNGVRVHQLLQIRGIYFVILFLIYNLEIVKCNFCLIRFNLNFYKERVHNYIY